MNGTREELTIKALRLRGLPLLTRAQFLGAWLEAADKAQTKEEVK